MKPQKILSEAAKVVVPIPIEEFVSYLFPQYRAFVWFLIAVYFTHLMTQSRYGKKGIFCIRKKLGKLSPRKLAMSYVFVCLFGAGLFAFYWWGVNKIHDKMFRTVIAFPWIGTAYRDATPTCAIGLQLLIRDYPVSRGEQNMVLSLSSLFHVDLTISEVVSVSAIQEGWTEKGIRTWKQDEWNSDDTARDVNWYTILKETPVLTLRGQTRNAHWEGYLILRREGDSILWKQAIRGNSTNGSIAMTEERTASQIIRKEEFVPLTKAELIRLGVPPQ